MIDAGKCLHIRVLILSKDYTAQGGVVNFISSLTEHFSSRVIYENLFVGRSTDAKGLLANTFAPIIDNYHLASRVIKNGYDCIHINPSMNLNSLLRDGMFILTLSVLRYRNILILFHGWNDNDYQKISNNKLFKFIFKKIFRRAKLILVLASSFKLDLQSLGMRADKIEVTTTMFNGEILKKTIKNGDYKTILYLSRFVKEKGVYELLAGFKNVRNKYPEVRLVMAGDGPEREHMMDWVGTNNLVGAVMFPGYLRGEQKAQALVNAEIFVFPTYYGEGCPVALLEAMAAGLPIITHAVGGIPDIFKDGINGILLNNISADNIQTAIIKLLENKKLSKQIGITNREVAWEKYEAKVITRKMEEIYRKVSL